jgi:hypothetical protein
MANESLFQSTWFQDYVAGDDNNPGTLLRPVRSVGEIRRRWQGGVAGARPLLPVSQTVNLVSPAPDFSDPLLVLANVDLMAGVQLLVQPAAAGIKRSGTITAIANPFAQTATGQLAIVDAGVADWTSDRELLLVDSTRSAVCWVTGGAAQGVLSSVRAAIISAVPPFAGLGPTVTLAAGDTYSIVTPLPVYFGTGSRTSWYPNGGTNSAAPPAVTFYRLRGLSQDALRDPLRLTSDGGRFAGAALLFNECRVDQSVYTLAGAAAYFNNCSMQSTQILQGLTHFQDVSNVFLFAGYSRAFLFLYGGVILDQDFSILAAPVGAAALNVFGGVNVIGSVSAYTPGPGPAVVVANGAQMLLQRNLDPVAILYGTVGGAANPIFDVGSGSITYHNPNAVPMFSFDSTLFQLAAQANGWGFSRTLGFVGPTSCTLAHQDAALGVGTGFGASSQDPPTGARFLSYVA